MLVDMETHFFLQSKKGQKKLKLFKRHIGILSEYTEGNKSCIV